MFTGIIEGMGTVKQIVPEGGNVHLDIASDFQAELKVDQSVAHNGVCLTVVSFEEDTYRVTAIHETLAKTNLGHLEPGARMNLERCLQAGGRLDGHIVQGHVDQTATVESIVNEDGSWKFTFHHEQNPENITVTKGSICVNGVSLTVVDAEPERFSVAIIPFTYEHTSFADLKVGDTVNLEFDILGKYIGAYLQRSGRL